VRFVDNPTAAFAEGAALLIARHFRQRFGIEQRAIIDNADAKIVRHFGRDQKRDRRFASPGCARNKVGAPRLIRRAVANDRSFSALYLARQLATSRAGDSAQIELALFSGRLAAS
jgi:hypothetical protein